MERKGGRDDLTPVEVREMVETTKELLTRRAGVARRRQRRPVSNEEVQRRLELIRRQANARTRGD